jgi:hypothetical protein
MTVIEYYIGKKKRKKKRRKMWKILRQANRKCLWEAFGIREGVCSGRM